MQSLWPEGRDGRLHIVGTARDLWTSEARPRTIGEERIDAWLSPDKLIENITGARVDVPWSALSGVRPGGPLRKLMGNLLPQERDTASLLHRLLDELGGTAFLAPAAWIFWAPNGGHDSHAGRSRRTVTKGPMEGVCVSFQAGSPAMTADGSPNHENSSHPMALPPFRADDELAWHRFIADSGPNHWRIRYTDIWREGSVLHVAAGFQDSAALADRDDLRTLYHEYILEAKVDLADYTLADIRLTAGSLPFTSCLGALPGGGALIGMPLAEFGRTVPVLLAGTAGCTHLNEVLRNLSDVPALAAELVKLENDEMATNQERLR